MRIQKKKSSKRLFAIVILAMVLILAGGVMLYYYSGLNGHQPDTTNNDNRENSNRETVNKNNTLPDSTIDGAEQAGDSINSQTPIQNEGQSPDNPNHNCIDANCSNFDIPENEQ